MNRADVVTAAGLLALGAAAWVLLGLLAASVLVTVAAVGALAVAGSRT